MDKILIVGFGGHAKSIADSIKRQGKYEIAGYTELEDKCNNYNYLGDDSKLESIFKSGIHNAVVGIGYLGHSDVREKIFNRLKQIGFNCPIIADPSSVISECAIIGEGTFIGKGAVINSEANIGKMCIINSKAVIEHDCVVGDYSHIAVASVLCGEVKVGKSVLVGANATVIQCKIIEDNSIIPAGNVIR